MANTLRRKMFRLGGEVNTHGVGITSGLEYRRPGYNAGGQVQATFGVGNNANKMIGPDGKIREANAAFFPTALKYIAQSLLPVGSTASSRGIGAALSGGSKAVKKYFGPRRTTSRVEKVIPGSPEKYGLSNALIASGPPTKYGMPAFVPSARKLISPAVAERRLKQLRLDPITLSQRLGQGMRIGGAGVAAGTVAGIGSALLPNKPFSEDDTAFRRSADALRSGAETVADLGTYIPAAIAQSFSRKPEDIQYLTDLMKGEKAEEVVGSDNDTAGGLNQKDISPAMETIQTQEEQFAKMKDDADQRAEMYYDMLSDGGPNKSRALSDALIASGAVYDEDKGQALAAFKGGIDQELDRDDALRDESKRLAINDIVTQDATTRQELKAREQMVAQAKLAIMTSPDMTAEQRSSGIAQLEAFEQGIINLLPTNDKQDDLDTTKMKPGAVYLDITGITDGTYVAVNSDKDDPNQVDSFNSIPEAKAHAAS